MGSYTFQEKDDVDIFTEEIDTFQEIMNILILLWPTFNSYD